MSIAKNYNAYPWIIKIAGPQKGSWWFSNRNLEKTNWTSLDNEISNGLSLIINNMSPKSIIDIMK